MKNRLIGLAFPSTFVNRCSAFDIQEVLVFSGPSKESVEDKDCLGMSLARVCLGANSRRTVSSLQGSFPIYIDKTIGEGQIESAVGPSLPCRIIVTDVCVPEGV